MDEPKVLIKEPRGGAPKKAAPDLMAGWSLLWVVGWTFLIIGMLNVILIWIPLQLGNPEYEFGSAANALDSMPLPTMGLVFIFASARSQAREVGALVAQVVAVLLILLVLVMGTLYWLNVPTALKAVQQPAIQFGLKKSILKVTVQTVLYPIALFTFIMVGKRKLQGR